MLVIHQNHGAGIDAVLHCAAVIAGDTTHINLQCILICTGKNRHTVIVTVGDLSGVAACHTAHFIGTGVSPDRQRVGSKRRAEITPGNGAGVILCNDTVIAIGKQLVIHQAQGGNGTGVGLEHTAVLALQAGDSITLAIQNTLKFRNRYPAAGQNTAEGIILIGEGNAFHNLEVLIRVAAQHGQLLLGADQVRGIAGAVTGQRNDLQAADGAVASAVIRRNGQNRIPGDGNFAAGRYRRAGGSGFRRVTAVQGIIDGTAICTAAQDKRALSRNDGLFALMSLHIGKIGTAVSQFRIAVRTGDPVGTGNGGTHQTCQECLALQFGGGHAHTGLGCTGEQILIVVAAGSDAQSQGIFFGLGVLAGGAGRNSQRTVAAGNGSVILPDHGGIGTGIVTIRLHAADSTAVRNRTAVFGTDHGSFHRESVHHNVAVTDTGVDRAVIVGAKKRPIHLGMVGGIVQTFQCAAFANCVKQRTVGSDGIAVAIEAATELLAVGIIPAGTGHIQAVFQTDMLTFIGNTLGQLIHEVAHLLLGFDQIGACFRTAAGSKAGRNGAVPGSVAHSGHTDAEEADTHSHAQQYDGHGVQ